RSMDRLDDIRGGEAISDAEQIQLGDNLADGGRGEEDTRRTPVSRVSGAVMINPHPALGEDVNAFDGVHRRALGYLGHRTAVCIARVNPLPVLVGRVDDRLPALDEQLLDELHLGVRRPEHPDPVLAHDFLHLVFAAPIPALWVSQSPRACGPWRAPEAAPWPPPPKAPPHHPPFQPAPRPPPSG